MHTSSDALAARVEIGVEFELRAEVADAFQIHDTVTRKIRVRQIPAYR
ncbi:hypothetical protein [Nocardia noduli]|nr:hypothetical protein [Nocardia noduli]